jgi:hypothetical protein
MTYKDNDNSLNSHFIIKQNEYKITTKKGEINEHQRKPKH